MPREAKKGLEKFSFHVDFFQNEAIVGVAGEFGLKGEIAVVKLLCAIFRNGYFYLWSDRNRQSLADSLPGISLSLLDLIVRRLVKSGFFDSLLFDSAHVLTSKTIQLHYQSECRRLHRRPDIRPYNLLAAPPQSQPQHLPLNPEEDPPSFPKTVPASRGAGMPGIPLSESIPKIKEDIIWCEATCMRFCIPMPCLLSYLDAFALHCSTTLGQLSHENLQHAKRHFCQTLNKYGNKFFDNIISRRCGHQPVPRTGQRPATLADAAEAILRGSADRLPGLDD